MSYIKKHICVLLSLFSIIICASALANEIEEKFISSGLVDVSTVDRTIRVSLVNSDPQKNFFRENYYKGLSRAYLRKEVAVKLKKAQINLVTKYPLYSLQVLDAARPRSVSRLMYDKMKGSKFEKYVADPKKGSMHNYGIAIDITIVDASGQELDMGYSPFNKSRTQLIWQFAQMKLGKKPSQRQLKNRKLLADSMKEAGFIPLSFEWWHFNGMEKNKARRRYTIIE